MQVSIEIWYDNHCLCNSIHVGDLIHKDMIYYILKIIHKYYEAIWGKRVIPFTSMVISLIGYTGFDEAYHNFDFYNF